MDHDCCGDGTKLVKNQSVCFPFDFFFHSSINDCEKKYQMTFNEALLLFQSSSNLSGLIVILRYHKCYHNDIRNFMNV